MPGPVFPDIPSKPPGPAELLRRHGLRPRKSLGQHFLRRPEAALRIVEAAALPPHETVVELGAGLGILTWALSLRFRRVIAYELDEKLLSVLRKENFLPSRVEIRRGDILRLDYAALRREVGRPLILFGNLPYYLSSRLLYRLYELHELFEAAVFMFQREVAERLLASPGGKNYGLLSVLTSLLTEARRLMLLSPGEFYPPPEVASAVVKLVFRREFLPEGIFRLLKVAFSRRRKKLLRNLATVWPEEAIREAFRDLGLAENIRAEAVGPEVYLELARRLEVHEPVQKGKKDLPGGSI
ncbi:16S rRNA (adenine(1518)-N(6)/adenine(1519)-N(6))-dimethyltransferase RsmA [Thermosulfurimonas sp. F29]|uniref:16S rRNA (adenine(1518)-N(6)/adenine(1519)-N(6))- dimethyltransferase RsmA n=1 Tax=Thermosulfurimonas sp. F29 TaxID=2867247 RepID=UPI001C831C1A|nr:16S rRNA (adenine(1518)-N(6)/adenine(1519)-N(6))-dimethyltransferase RsmA [Thermosulfurimonas sp. F29]MBX6423663.1 16S rRNA (adenine(1518)-N(6)/adenine(1519)-N(6))-dimethyltransferase RsmA [Thermosulfurimonas sp. F29]